MLKLSASLINQPVVSLRTGSPVATAESAIINPNNLKIEGFYCLDHFSKRRLILLAQDIRDLVPQGMVINDHDVLVEPGELIRLKSVLEIQFELIGKHVKTAKGEKVGKVNDYAVDDQSLIIQKIYVGQSLLKSFSHGQITVDRNEIVEVTNKKVVIKELLKPSKSGITATAPAI